MKLLPLGSAILVVGAVSLAGTFGVANPSAHDDVRHRSSLRVMLTSVDGLLERHPPGRRLLHQHVLPSGAERRQDG